MKLNILFVGKKGAIVNKLIRVARQTVFALCWLFNSTYDAKIRFEYPKVNSFAFMGLTNAIANPK